MPDNGASANLPAVVALCPIHADGFYVPHGGLCPECDRELVVYQAQAEVERLQGVVEILHTACEGIANGASGAHRIALGALVLASELRRPNA